MVARHDADGGTATDGDGDGDGDGSGTGSSNGNGSAMGLIQLEEVVTGKDSYFGAGGIAISADGYLYVEYMGDIIRAPADAFDDDAPVFLSHADAPENSVFSSVLNDVDGNIYVNTRRGSTYAVAADGTLELHHDATREGAYWALGFHVTSMSIGSADFSVFGGGRIMVSEIHGDLRNHIEFAGAGQSEATVGATGMGGHIDNLVAQPNGTYAGSRREDGRLKLMRGDVRDEEHSTIDALPTVQDLIYESAAPDPWGGFYVAGQKKLPRGWDYFLIHIDEDATDERGIYFVKPQQDFTDVLPASGDCQLTADLDGNLYLGISGLIRKIVFLDG